MYNIQVDMEMYFSIFLWNRKEDVQDTCIWTTMFFSKFAFRITQYGCPSIVPVLGVRNNNRVYRHYSDPDRHSHVRFCNPVRQEEPIQRLLGHPQLLHFTVYLHGDAWNWKISPTAIVPELLLRSIVYIYCG